jgi:vesicle coat complex subunit
MGYRVHLAGKLLVAAALCVAACPATEVPRLTQELADRDPKVRSQAALRLGRIGMPHAGRAIGALIPLLEDPNSGVRSAAAYALRKVDTPEARKALDAQRRFRR